MVNFLHFSDFHIQERRGILKEGVDTCLKLERVIEVAREMDVKPAFSIVTGDISQDGSEEGYVIESNNITWIDPADPNITPQMKDKYPGKELYVGTVEPGSRFSFTISPGEGSGENPLFIFAIIAVILILVIATVYFRKNRESPVEKTNDDDKESDDEKTEPVTTQSRFIQTIS